MNSRSLLLFTAPLALAAAVAILAGPARGAPAPAKPLPLGNATCPVKGSPVDPKVTLVWNDIEVAFCCADCPEKFKAEPLKYMPALLRDLATQLAAAKAQTPGERAGGSAAPRAARAAQGAALVDLSNANCPVMGGTAKASVFGVYHGMKVRFCCPGCDAKFQADPARYLTVLRADPDVAKRIDDAEAAWNARGGK